MPSRGQNHVWSMFEQRKSSITSERGDDSPTARWTYVPYSLLFIATGITSQMRVLPLTAISRTHTDNVFQVFFGAKKVL
jgi:hypothetical protein